MQLLTAAADTHTVKESVSPSATVLSVHCPPYKTKKKNFAERSQISINLSLSVKLRFGIYFEGSGKLCRCFELIR